MTIHNHSAGFVWIGSLALIALVGGVTLELLRDGGSLRYALTAVMPVLALLWLGVIALLVSAARLPCWKVTLLSDGRISVVSRYPFRVVTRCYRPGDLAGAYLLDSRDHEGRPYYQVQLALPDGEIVPLAEGRRRKACLSICRRFNRMLSATGSSVTPMGEA